MKTLTKLIPLVRLTHKREGKLFRTLYKHVTGNPIGKIQTPEYAEYLEWLMYLLLSERVLEMRKKAVKVGMLT